MMVAPGQTQVISGTAGAFGPSRMLVQRIRMRGSDRVVPLFAVWCPASIEFVTQERITIDRESLTISRQGPDAPLSYIVSSTVPVESAASALASGAEVLRGQVDRAAVPPTISAIARDILTKARIEPDPAIRPATDDALAMRAMESFLRREFSYTLDLVAAPSGRDPVEWFITTEKRGNCEYFASALALMGRSVGIPTRVITGYVAAEFSEATSSYVVRQSNAHAWVEARTSPVPLGLLAYSEHDERTPSWHGWQTYDPTPPEDFRRVHRPEPNLAGKLGQILDSMEYFWVANVVTFDDSKQTALLDRRTTSWIEERLRSLMQVDPETGEPRQSAAKRIGTVVGTVMGATLLVFGIIGLLRWLGTRFWSRRAPTDRSEALSPTSARLYRELDSWLTRHPSASPRVLPLMRRVDGIADPEAVPILSAAATALNAERFGGVALSPERAAELLTQIRGLTLPGKSENT
jgi:transglutaminase-like putative cysteine protease